ncbi:glycosyltransferase family 4 protein [uncultured Methanobrevibacter sp.]|uniref:glycosyltransferase family 4 protein n=1 Tax=uncultured Methanobrevibacter sp. TaxID=253161 RepID=UPI0025FEC562|nr:glycosyltransferase family 4 protein [uncultured Methanobrevibacter sp.]
MSRERDSKCLTEISDKKAVNAGAIRKISQFIRDNEFDIVHINSSYTYVGAIAALKENVPFVWHIRELLEEDQGNTMWDRKEANDLINKSDRVIAISGAVNSKYSQFIDSDRLVTVHDGVDIEKFYNPQKGIFNESPIKIIFVGNIAGYKGIFDFAEACILLNKSDFKDFEVLIVGAGDSQVIADIKSRFSKANMSDKVKLLGYQKDVEAFLNESDIFCMCSKSEAFGRTTVEAMLSGNLVIGANTAGTRDLIDDGVTGFYYEQGNSKDLCKKMLFAINNKSKSREIAKSGRKYMFENMSAEKNADEIHDLYMEILNC